MKHWLDWDWDGARIEFERAIRINPSYAQAHQWYAELLASLGMLDSAVAEVKRAEALDPLSPVIVWNVWRILWFARRADEARERYERVLEFAPDHPGGHEGLLRISVHQGRDADAVRHLKGLMQGSRADPSALSVVDRAFAAGGMRGVYQAIHQRIGRLDRRDYLGLLALGRHDEALAAIEKAYREREFEKDIPDMVNDPNLDPIRSHPRFQAVLRAMGLSSARRGG